MCRENNRFHCRERVKALTNKEEESSALAHLKNFSNIPDNLKYTVVAAIGWPLYLPPQMMPIFLQSSQTYASLFSLYNFLFRKVKRPVL